MSNASDSNFNGPLKIIRLPSERSVPKTIFSRQDNRSMNTSHNFKRDGMPSIKQILSITPSSLNNKMLRKSVMSPYSNNSIKQERFENMDFSKNFKLRKNVPINDYAETGPLKYQSTRLSH